MMTNTNQNRAAQPSAMSKPWISQATSMVLKAGIHELIDLGFFIQNEQVVRCSAHRTSHLRH